MSSTKSSPFKPEPEKVAGKVLKRVELSKMARKLQNRLALARFKTKHGWEDLPLDRIEPKVEEEKRRKRLAEGDMHSDSSSSTSDLPYPTRTLMSSPLKGPIFSDAIGSSNGITGHRKRSFNAATFDHALSSPIKRMRSSPTPFPRSFAASETLSTWKDNHNLAQSSPIKPRRQQHFTTSTGPDVSFYSGSRKMADVLASSPNYGALSDDDEDLPTHSFIVHKVRSSPPSTPPMRNRGIPNWRQPSSVSGRNVKGGTGGSKVVTSGEEGADLLLYLAASPSPAYPKSRASGMEPPSTPPSKLSDSGNKMALPSSILTSPGGGNLLHPTTPGLAFDFADFVHMTPSPAPKPWKAAVPLSGGPTRTPISGARRRLTFD